VIAAAPGRNWASQRLGRYVMTYKIVASQQMYDGAIIKVRVDTVVLPDGSQVKAQESRSYGQPQGSCRVSLGLEAWLSQVGHTCR
jgi:hypothetical protein